MNPDRSVPRAGSAPASIGGVPWPVLTCIVSTFFLRSGSFAAGVLLGLHLARLANRGEPVSELTIGLLSAVFFTVEVIGAPLFGVLGDRIGHRPFLLAGPIAGGISAQLLGLTIVVPLLLIVMAFKGLSAATSIPSTLAYLSYGTRHSDGARTRAVAWFEIASVAGIGLGGFLGGMFWTVLGDFAFTAVAVLYATAFLLLLAIRPDDVPRGTGGERHLRDYGRLLRQPRLVRFIPAWIAVNAIIGLWVQHAPFALSKQPNPEQLLQGGYSGAIVGGAFAGIGIVFILGIWFWGQALVGRPRTAGMYVGVVGLIALSLVLFLLNHSGSSWGPLQWTLLALTGLAMLVAAGFTPAALSHLADVAEEQGEDRGAVMGLYSVFFGVGQVSGALLGGAFGLMFGADGLIALTTLLTLLAYGSIRLIRADTARRPSLHTRIVPAEPTAAIPPAD